MIIAGTDLLPASTSLTPGITSGGYFQKVDNTTLADTVIAPGDKFMFYADNNAAPDASAGNPTGELLWHLRGTVGIMHQSVTNLPTRL